MNPTEKLFQSELKVINIGVEHFADALKLQNVKVEHVDWKPPAGGDKEMADLLEELGF